MEISIKTFDKYSKTERRMNVEKKEKTIKQKSLWQEIWKNKAIYLIMLPGIIWFIVFSYGPMSGLQLAFKTYSMKRGIWGSPWC